MPDKRRHSRAEAGFKAEVVVDGVAAEVVTRNLSMKGLLATANPLVVTGALCAVRIRLAPAMTMVMEGRVVRSDEESIAVDFLGMDDESFNLLHRLMQWNAEDADIIDEELQKPYFKE
ncbi:MAG: PilZ domain-containing protein [Proteobacteria bacterium]|nr:PilZ domain-containing protein [Pseudomonadota bacterium]MBU1611809.1 PilZ domain-containing protein [Pseudomonadota bacterium]